MGNICTNQRDRETNLFIERMLELQRELTIKEYDLEQTKVKLVHANKLLEDKQISDWTNTSSGNLRKKNYYN